MSDFHFLRPLWLLLIPVGMALIGYLRYRRHATSRWHEWVDEHLIGHLLSKDSRAGIWVTIGLYLCCAVAGIALAGPAWEKRAAATHQVQQGRVLIMDLSSSMRARDMAPSRLLRAKFKLVDLIRSGDQMYQGLIAFAGDAHVVAPMTDDTDTLLHLLRELDSSTLPSQGSRLDRALQAAESLFSNAGLPPGQIVAILDGATHHAQKQAAQLGQRGFQLLMLVAGTARGAPIPDADGGLIKDAAGNIVIAAVDQAQLASIAAMANGDARFITANDQDIQWVERLRKTPSAFRHTQKTGDHALLTGDRWHDRGYLLIPILIVLCALLFRRGWLLILLITVPLTEHPRAFAGDEKTAIGQAVVEQQSTPDRLTEFWNRLWLRPGQIAARQFADANYAGINNDAPSPWRAAAKYRQGEYIAAAELLSATANPSADALYNHGNALALAGKLHEAIAAYDKALGLNIGHEDAAWNKTVVEKLLQQQQESDQGSAQRSEHPPQTSAQDNPQQTTDAHQSGLDQRDNPQQQSADSHQPAATQSASQPQPDTSRTDSAAADSDQANTGEQQNAPRPENDREPYTQDNEADSAQQYSTSQQAIRQLLERIPDDPGGILQRKFAGQSAERNLPAEAQPW